MKKKERAKFVFSELKKLYPNPKTELKNWKTNFQFLVCVILSAQTTDIQVNKVTKELFCKYPDILSFSKANLKVLEKSLSSINYYKTKARHLVAMSNLLVKDFKGEVPILEKDLLKLPGVGKKTANVFLNELFHANQGIAVDTHVARVARRLDLTKSKDPLRISLDLEKIFPKKEWYRINSTFVLFGRYVCKARAPLCFDCPLNEVCRVGIGQKKDPQI